MKIEIKNRWSGSVLFSGEFGSLKLAVEAARKAKTVLRGAVLTGADLRGADLRGVVLRDAVLRGAVLTGADLENADLRGAVLRDAVLTGAVLRDAVLTGADLENAYLTGAYLKGAVLTPIRDDIWAVLCSAPSEVKALREAIATGRIDGSQYEGECRCLIGTLAAARHVSFNEIHGLTPNPNRPSEQFFGAIKKGDTPATSQFSALVLQWVDQWLANMEAAFGGKEGAK